MNISIAIPARYGSSRFPGKPLALIHGKSMLSRVVELAKDTAAHFSGDKATNVDVFVTTEDARIAEHTDEIGVRCIMTGDDCQTGSDRVLAAAKQLDQKPDFIINLQGDAPLTPKAALLAIINALISNDEMSVATPVHRLSWKQLDQLREAKKTTPFSGTTAIMHPETGRAMWFSKNIIPAIRKEADLRNSSDISPIYQHMGLYGYRTDVLETFCALPQSHFEMLEGLEQLRLLENGIPVQCVEVEIGHDDIQSGIDSPEDLARIEKLLAEREGS